MISGHCECGRVTFEIAGTMQDNPPRPAAYHAYVASKAPWYDITDEYEQYETNPPEG